MATATTEAQDVGVSIGLTHGKLLAIALIGRVGSPKEFQFVNAPCKVFSMGILAPPIAGLYIYINKYIYIYIYPVRTLVTLKHDIATPSKIEKSYTSNIFTCLVDFICRSFRGVTTLVRALGQVLQLH
jgi:hypothetical protein